MTATLRLATVLALLVGLSLLTISTPPAVGQSCVPPPAGMIAWWPMDELTGTTVADAAGSNPGVHVGAPTHEAGESGEALRFNGGGSFVAVQDNDLWAFGSSDFTIELWANFATSGGGSVGHGGDVFIANDESQGTANKWFFAYGGGYLYFHINGPGIGDQFFDLVSFYPQIGRWYHLAIRRSGSTYTIFIDGVAAGSADNTVAIPNANTPLTIGEAEGLFYMNGLLDEVTIYNRALADAEVNSIFQAGNAGKCKALSVHTSSLSLGQIGKAYSQQMEALFGTPPLAWSISGGSLPAGLTLSSDGLLSGTPTQGSTSAITVRVTDATTATADRSFTLEVLATLPPPSLRIHKTGTIPVPGRTVDYFIIVDNVGSVDAHNIEVSELLDPLNQFTDPSLTTPPVSQIRGNTLIWKIDEIVPGSFKFLNYRVTLRPSVGLGTLVKGQVNIVCDQCRDTDSCRNLGVACDFFDPSVIPTGLGLSDLFGIFFNLHFPSTACTGFTAQCAEDCRQVCPHDSHNQNAQGPSDPNEKLVASGRYVPADQTLVYPIHFENVGTLEAIDVFVTDVLDPNLADSTLQILSPGGSYNPATRTVSWSLLGRNLQPGESDSVLLSIKPLPGLQSGTDVRNAATIQFEALTPMTTNEVVNTIDTTPPSCVMAPLPPEVTTPSFPIAWSGTDAIGEIDTFNIFVSTDGGPYVLTINGAKETSRTFDGQSGKRYDFICIAQDTAGNAEVQEPIAEAGTVVNQPGPPDTDRDSVPDSTDNCPFVANPDQADADGDGIGDLCDNCPNDFSPAQSDGNHNGIGDLCDGGTPMPLAVSRVHLKTAPHGSISVRATLDVTEWGSLGDALARGLTIGVIGVGLPSPEILSSQYPRCIALSASRTVCVGTQGESTVFVKQRSGNRYNVRIRAGSRTFSPPLRASALQVVVSAGGLDRRDTIPSCKVSRTGTTATCSK